MERINQQKGFHSEEQWKIAKAIKDGFVSVQSEMWRHRAYFSSFPKQNAFQSLEENLSTMVLFPCRAKCGDTESEMWRHR
ncbi:unnamed protein product, partial [Porites evermanni]